ncbi:hypothetical protein MTR67_036054 [Solanum verrucosum]|uniref:Reverse transcriptase zinc-binding domain-containing protein n=1 Tax=Solanum verrucosum TaxID=315347 RepID=A0AAF0UBB8_SOLVR|nr:hypothetical protein MTR67_036054 [Solanum verrucosum]
MKVSFFVWLVIRKACLTQDKLQRRGLQICSRCLLCEHESENNEHLFLHCRTTINLWHMCLPLYFGNNLVIPSSTLEMLNNWWSIGNRGGEEDW